MKSVLADGCILKLQNFEGPFDLLFYLIEKNKMEIYDIQINEITDQYMDYLFAMQELDLEIASEFLLVASTLLHIKSRLLLPKENEKQEEEMDPREQLILRLVEYRKFKEFAGSLKNREEEWVGVFYKLPEPVQLDEPEEVLLDLCPIKLKESYINVLSEFKEKMNDPSQKMNKIIEHEKVSLKAKMKDILNMLKIKAKVYFSEVFNLKANSRLEIATGFLGMLELVKLKKAYIEQENAFDEILIKTAGDFTLEFEEQNDYKEEVV